MSSEVAAFITSNSKSFSQWAQWYSYIGMEDNAPVNMRRRAGTRSPVSLLGFL